MKILVTGASGFVGSSVVKTLRQHSHEVVGLIHSPHKGAALEQLGATVAIGDMMQPASYEKLVPSVDKVIHAAQYTIKGRFTWHRLKQIEDADALMTETLANACIRHDKALIYTSGCFNYGDCGDTWITEERAFNPSPLGRGHTRMVQLLQGLRQEQQLKVIILSPGFVYGPGGLFKQSFYDTEKKGQLRVFGNGQNYWSSVHVDDFAMAYALACESQNFGEMYNIVDDSPLRLRDLIGAFMDALGKPHVGSFPPWLLKLLIGTPLVDSLVTSFRIKNTKARQQLGWQPRYTSLQEGIPTVLRNLQSASD